MFSDDTVKLLMAWSANDILSNFPIKTLMQALTDKYSD